MNRGDIAGNAFKVFERLLCVASLALLLSAVQAPLAAHDSGTAVPSPAEQPAPAQPGGSA